MKVITKYMLLTVVFATLTSALYQDHSKFDAQINTLKTESKNAIKPARYESSRITYYTVEQNTLTRNLEIPLVASNEYIISVNGKLCSTATELNIYDRNSDSEKRNLLKTVDIQGKNIVIGTDELNETFRKFNTKSDRAKTLYLEYKISNGEENKEAIILVLGLK